MSPFLLLNLTDVIYIIGDVGGVVNWGEYWILLNCSYVKVTD